MSDAAIRRHGRVERNAPAYMYCPPTYWTLLRIRILEHKRCYLIALLYNRRQTNTIGYCKYNKWQLSQQAYYGGNAVNATQKYELIRLTLKGERTPRQASEETGIPLSTFHLAFYLQSGLLALT